MCWNESVSLNTFLFSSFVLLLIIYNNYYTKYKIPELNNVWIYLFLASFISMQLTFNLQTKIWYGDWYYFVTTIGNKIILKFMGIFKSYLIRYVLEIKH